MNAEFDFQQRLDELEAHVTHQDQTIQDLHDVTLQQWDEIKTLTGKLEQLEAKIKTAETAVDPTPEPPPPHY